MLKKYLIKFSTLNFNFIWKKPLQSFFVTHFHGENHVNPITPKYHLKQLRPSAYYTQPICSPYSNIGCFFIDFEDDLELVDSCCISTLRFSWVPLSSVRIFFKSLRVRFDLDWSKYKLRLAAYSDVSNFFPLRFKRNTAASFLSDWLVFLWKKTSMYIGLFFSLPSASFSMKELTASDVVKGPGCGCFLKKSRSSSSWHSVLVLIISFCEKTLFSSTFTFWFHWSFSSLISIAGFLYFLKSDEFFIVKSADLFNIILCDTDAKFCFPWMRGS